MYRKAGMLSILGPMCIGLIGCQTQATSERFASAQTNALTCQQRVLSYKEKLANAPRAQFTDERNMLVFLVVQELAKSKSSDEMSSCNQLYTAMINADAQKTSGLIRGGVSLGGIGLGLVGLNILTNGLSRNDGGSSGDTWNVSGSRVNSKSGNVSGGGNSSVSSSGEGLGFGNTFSTGSGQSVGGIEPRTTPNNGNINDLNTGSNSGTNEPITIPPVEEITPSE